MSMLAGPLPYGRRVAPRDSGSLIPPPGPVTIAGPYVFDAQSARQVPGVARAIQLYGGMVKQMPMDAYRGYQRLAQPRLLAAPDPSRAGPWFVQISVEDYLLSGNAVSLVTARGADGWPLSVQWLPISWVYIQWNVYWGAETDVTYYYLGQALPYEDVIHVRRGADRTYPVRGVGVVEEALTTLDRVAMEEEYERQTLSGAAVPSVAIIAPQAVIPQDVADQAKSDWLAKFSGPVREPAILPNGTTVVPLAWSPTDTQMTEARHMSLIDVANIFNLDGYWLGAPVAGMTYRTAGPQYQQVLRTSLEPVLADFEAVWSNAWLPRGTNVRFRRSQLLREDLATSTTAAVAAYNAGIITVGEARVEIGLPPNMPAPIGVGSDIATPSNPDMTASADDPNAVLPEGEPGGPENG
jgi:HK97 family phage portal protein